MFTILYTARTTIYSAIEGTDCWGIDRDARLWSGPGKCIAHPPCGHWGKYNHKCTLPGRDCASIALSQVRKFGGILEHPASSTIWRHVVKPGEGRDFYNGFTIDIDQSVYGHAATKSTRLYCVNCQAPKPPMFPFTHRTKPLERMSRRQREATPPALAAALVAAVFGYECP